MAGFLAPFALTALALSQPSPEDLERCQQVRSVRALAEAHGLSTSELVSLERRYCGASARAEAPPPPPPPPRSERCHDLNTLAWLSSFEAPYYAHADVETARQIVCSGYGEAPTRWPGGKVARTSGGAWYWPDGRLAISSGSSWYYPSGRLARSSGGTWYYPNGRLARSSAGRWYTPDGDVSDETSLLTEACRRAGGCQQRLDELRDLDGDNRTASTLFFVWESNG